MMDLLYRALTRVAYGAALPVLGRLGERRDREWAERLGRARLPLPPGRRVWIHAASVGELMGVSPLVRGLSVRRPDLEVVVSTLTRTGQEKARSIDGVAATFFLPIDVPDVVRRGVRAVGASTLLVMETEIWPNLLREARAQGLRTAVVNGRISDRAFERYGLVRGVVAPALRTIDVFAVQSDRDRERYLALGAPGDRVEVLGSTKYDAMPSGQDAGLEQRFRAVLGERSRLPLWVAGCVRPGEEDAVLDAYGDVDRLQSLTLVVAPRHLERVDALEAGLAKRGIPSVRWTALRDGRPEPARAVVVDTIGDLGRFYSIASLAFVGGGLAPLGGHNPLEAAAFGIPILFGPHMENYRVPADRLTAAGGAKVVGDAATLARALEEWLAHPEAREAAGRAALGVAEGFRGAVDRALDVLESHGVFDGGPTRDGALEFRVLDERRTAWPRPLLRAASAVHRGGSATRRTLHALGALRSQDAGVPVISVGNLSLGGTGKTPLVAWLARRSVEAGVAVAILSRGYGRTGGGLRVVSRGQGPEVEWTEAGDEPWLLAALVPGASVIVSRDRAAAARHAVRELGSRLLILDDGFQHFRLGRTLDLVLLDARRFDARGASDEWLREGLGALSRAQAAVVTHADAPGAAALAAALAARFPQLPVIEARHRPARLAVLGGALGGDPLELGRKTVSCVSGLARPEGFERMVLELGARPVDAWRFPDHHPFERAEVEEILKVSGSRSEWIVTTEKDAVRLEGLGVPLGRWRALGVEMDFTRGRESLEALIEPILAAASGRRGVDP